MNIYVLFSLLLFLAPGGCPIYSIDLSTLEVPNDFQNELTLQSMLSSEMHQYRNRLNSNAKINELSAAQHFEQARSQGSDDLSDRSELIQNIEDRLKVIHYEAASPDEQDSEVKAETEHLSGKFYRSARDEDIFLGTNLFGTYPKKCFSAEDIALMSARRDFEMILPKSYPHGLLHDGIVYTLMKYFNSVNQIMKRMSDVETRRLLQRAFYDALGGYVHFYLLPVAQVSYYAGHLKLCTVQRLVALHRQCQLVLNTYGTGWKTPLADVLGQLKNVNIEAIKLNEEQGSENDAASCALLDQSCVNEDAQREQIIVPLPHLESEDSNGFLNNIFLPFKHRRIYNLRSPDAAFILVKFIKTLNNCYRFQGISPTTYNNKLRSWIRETLQIHYRDEIFYPGLGGVLQVYEALSYSTKPPNQCKEKQEPVLSEEDYKDYPNSPDDESSEKSSKRKNGKAKCQHNNNKDSASRKQSRSPPNPKDGEGTKSPKEHKESKEEECVEPNDDSYVFYIAIFLGLLLLLLLLIICCCMKRRKKKIIATVVTRQAKPAEKPSQTTIPPDVESAPPTTDEGNESLWSRLFRSRKKKRKERKKPNSSPDTKSIPPKTGMALIGSQQDNRLSYPMNPPNLEKYLPRKKASTTEYNYELASMTSTSSLGYQFPRKFIPLKSGREPQGEYYPKSERKRSKSVRKEPSLVRQQERQREPENKSQKARGISEKQSERRDSEAKDHSMEDYDIQQLYRHGKFKRQEGGEASPNHDREIDKVKPCDSDSSGKSNCCNGNSYPGRTRETSQDKNQDSKELPRPEPNASVVSPLAEQELQLDNQEAVLPPLSSQVGSSGDPGSNSASWGTTFDEEDAVAYHKDLRLGQAYSRQERRQDKSVYKA